MAEEIVEKQARAEIVKNEKARLKESCYNQRAIFKGFGARSISRSH